jgi:hypothetical protein
MAGLIQFIANKFGPLVTLNVSPQDPLPVSSQTKQTASAPSSFTPATADASVFTLAAGEKGFIQNLGTNPLFVKRGAGATSSSFNYVLAASAEVDDGTGGSLVIDDFVGVVSVAGTTPRFIAWKA